MGGLVSGKLLLVLLIGLIVLGPEKLPEVARGAGRWMSEFRRVTGNLQSELREAFDTTELAAPVEELRSATHSLRTTLTSGWISAPLGAADTYSAPPRPAPVPRPGPGSEGASGPGVPLPTGNGTVWPGELGPPPGDPSLN